jgi:ABC-type branched-subunit amino acid transport system permease subunit
VEFLLMAVLGGLGGTVLGAVVGAGSAVEFLDEGLAARWSRLVVARCDRRGGS